MAQKHTVVRQAWSEYERGWGKRPDGHTLHLTKADRDAYEAEYISKHHTSSEAPDEYSQMDGDPTLYDVDDVLYAIIKASKNGIMETETIIREMREREAERAEESALMESVAPKTSEGGRIVSPVKPKRPAKKAYTPDELKLKDLRRKLKEARLALGRSQRDATSLFDLAKRRVEESDALRKERDALSEAAIEADAQRATDRQTIEELREKLSALARGSDALSETLNKIRSERDARPKGITREIAAAYCHMMSLPPEDQEDANILGCADTVLEALNDFVNEE
jgi:chromosome segregation ATPase